MSRLAILLVLILLTFSSSAMAQTPSAPPLTYIKGEVLDVAPIQESTQKTFLTGQGDVVTLRLTTGPEKGKIVDT
ncbi:MAG: hypothetical protein K0Q77_3118, partial [Anaerosporomusa subterranea]|nr:hypothetical protein [Anaerosporomusa subterranea]